jgi:hypothetical protein
LNELDVVLREVAGFVEPIEVGPERTSVSARSTTDVSPVPTSRNGMTPTEVIEHDATASAPSAPASRHRPATPARLPKTSI